MYIANALYSQDMNSGSILRDARIQGGLAQIGPLDATDLLAFLFKTDGGHERSWVMAATNLLA